MKMTPNFVALCLLLVITGTLGFDVKCMQPKDPGPCRGRVRRFYFDSDAQKCKRFDYSGCQGNDNNFETMENCQQTCESPSSGDGDDSSTAFRCSKPQDPGPCMASMRRFSYDYRTKTCKPFTYGGCQGNANNFETREECLKACLPGQGGNSPSPDNPADSGNKLDCMKPKDPGPCRRRVDRWYYDGKREKCRQFVYGGCQGNENNFETKQDCEQKCQSSGGSSSPGGSGPTGNKLDCMKPKDPGPCMGRINRWYFDEKREKCRQFVYGGCRGNENNFETKQDCEQKCIGGGNSGSSGNAWNPRMQGDNSFNPYGPY